MDGTRSFNSEQTQSLVFIARSSTQEKENSTYDVKTSELATLVTHALEKLAEFSVVQECVRQWVREAGYHYRSCVCAGNILTITYAEEFMGEKQQLLIVIHASYRVLIPSDRVW